MQAKADIKKVRITVQIDDRQIVYAGEMSFFYLAQMMQEWDDIGMIPIEASDKKRHFSKRLRRKK